MSARRGDCTAGASEAQRSRRSAAPRARATPRRGSVARAVKSSTRMNKLPLVLAALFVSACGPDSSYEVTQGEGVGSDSAQLCGDGPCGLQHGFDKTDDAFALTSNIRDYGYFVKPGQHGRAVVVMRNTGTTTWTR